MKLEEKLVNLRKENGVSQQELAEKLGVTRQAVSRWENGISLPSTENLIGLSELYRVDVEMLMDDGAKLTAAQEQSIEVVQPNCGLFRSRIMIVAIAWILGVLVCAAVCVPLLLMSARQNQNKGEEDVISIEELNVIPDFILPEEHAEFDLW